MRPTINRRPGSRVHNYVRAMTPCSEPVPNVDLGQLYRAIGALETQTRELLRKADEHEAETKDLNRNVICLTHSVAELDEKVTNTVMPVVVDVKNWKQRAIGMSLVGGLVSGGLLAQIKGWIW